MAWKLFRGSNMRIKYLRDNWWFGAFGMLCFLSIFFCMLEIGRKTENHLPRLIPKNWEWQRKWVGDIHNYSDYAIAYPHNYSYVLNEPDKCIRRIPFLVLMIPVAPHERPVRDAIRKTWGQENYVPGVVILRIFALGLPSGDRAPQIQAELERESQEHHDIIQKDFLDSYRNLTIKTMAILDWLASYCPGASYAMKIDTDMFLNVDYLVNKLLQPSALYPKKNYITGLVLENTAVHRNKDSKFYMPKEVFPSDIYPIYVSGVGYVFSIDLASKLLSASWLVEPVFLEDVYVGICLHELGIRPVRPSEQGLFSFDFIPYSKCRYSQLVATTGIQPEQLLVIWEDFHKAEGRVC
ncbi:beta-1,3-galactosyltransferase 2 [Amia ocellicauda]|uniref:beta-1,3-galactosyltransferase 2 n=1 Tax=Amia ocellicauda TaxID=2972642 RepID=UPI003463CD86